MQNVEALASKLTKLWHLLIFQKKSEMRGMLWQTLQKDLYYPLVADKNSYNSGNFEARSLKFGMVVDLDNTQS